MTFFVHREIEIFVYLTFNTEARKEQTLECGNQNVCSFVLMKRQGKSPPMIV